MNGLIRASLRNPIAVPVMTPTLALLGALAAYVIPVDILPAFRSPAVPVLTFYGGMPAASIEKNITSRTERGVVRASGGEWATLFVLPALYSLMVKDRESGPILAVTEGEGPHR
jgi:hypothetical protein